MVALSQGGEYDASALWNAAMTGRIELVRILVKAQADIAAVSKVFIVTFNNALLLLNPKVTTLTNNPLHTEWFDADLHRRL